MLKQVRAQAMLGFAGERQGFPVYRQEAPEESRAFGSQGTIVPTLGWQNHDV